VEDTCKAVLAQQMLQQAGHTQMYLHRCRVQQQQQQQGQDMTAAG
jgi:hypothetical protein